MRFLRHAFTEAQRRRILRLAEESLCLEVQFGTQKSVEAALNAVESSNLLTKQLIEEYSFMEKYEDVDKYSEKLWKEWRAIEDRYKRQDERLCRKHNRLNGHG